MKYLIDCQNSLHYQDSTIKIKLKCNNLIQAKPACKCYQSILEFESISFFYDILINIHRTSPACYPVVPKIWVRVGGHFECQRSVLGQKPSIQTQHPSWHCVATPNTKVKILDIFIITYLCLHIMIHMQKPYRIPCPTPVSKIRSVFPKQCDANKFPSEWSVAEFNQSVFHSSCLSRLKTKHFLFITPLC